VVPVVLVLSPVVEPAASVLPVVKAGAAVPSALPAAVVVHSLAAGAVPAVLVRPVLERVAAVPSAAPPVSARTPVVAALSVLPAAAALSLRVAAHLLEVAAPSALPADAARSPRVAVLSAPQQATAPSRRRVVASHFSRPMIFPSPDRAIACLFVHPAYAVLAPRGADY
jgi:hypothetical protein